MGITFLHFRNDHNVGDRWCCPADYFDFPSSRITLPNGNIPPGDAAVFGGGAIEGLIRQNKLHEKLAGSKKITWGTGNSARGTTAHRPPLDGFDIVGGREYGRDGTDYVPCVSCMHPFFDRKREILYDAVLFVNADPNIARPNIKGVPTLDNSASLETTVNWLASADVVLTNSFHGTYWGTLLKKRVVCIPYSSKFHGFKFPPEYIEDGAKWWASAAKARRYDEALEDSRHINIQFYEKVKNFIGF